MLKNVARNVRQGNFHIPLTSPEFIHQCENNYSQYGPYTIAQLQKTEFPKNYNYKTLPLRGQKTSHMRRKYLPVDKLLMRILAHFWGICFRTVIQFSEQWLKTGPASFESDCSMLIKGHYSSIEQIVSFYT